MNPYYSDSAVTIWHGDCREIMVRLNADVLITDPPYGLESLAGSYGRHGATIQHDADCMVRDGVLQLWGARPALVFGTPRLPEPPGTWNHRLVWDKAEPGMNGGPWRYTHELIFVRGDGWVRISNGSFSILKYPTQNGAVDRHIHPHKKPTNLMAALVGASPPGTILDPFMGSGTTLRAAKDLGRKAIGIEIEERYCEIAAKRMAQEVLL